MRSASWVGVRSPTAMSLVRWLPPSASTAVWLMAPFVKMAMSVVPPPMSTRQTPSSFSSSDRVASERASGCSTMSATLRPVRCAHLTMFCAEETAPGHDERLGLQADAAHAHRLLDAVLVVDDELLRQDVDDLAVERDGHGLGLRRSPGRRRTAGPPCP